MVCELGDEAGTDRHTNIIVLKIRNEGLGLTYFNTV